MIGFEFVANIAPFLTFRGSRGTRLSAPEVFQWDNPVSGLEISPDVRIWYVPHGPWNSLLDSNATLTVEDRAEFAAIRDLAQRQRSLTTRAVLRTALSETVGGRIGPCAWRFGRTETGKPTLVSGPKNLNFSCSHTEWASIVAVSASRDVGIDIEQLIIPSSEQWLSDTFTIGERTLINSLPTDDREWAISRLWTLKEAYLKMLGTGIAQALDVAFDPRSSRLVSGQQNRQAATTFKTVILNCQGQPLSVAIAISESTTKGAFWRQPIEGCLVRLRAKFSSSGRHTGSRAAVAAPLFRGAGRASA